MQKLSILKTIVAKEFAEIFCSYFKIRTQHLHRNFCDTKNALKKQHYKELYVQTSRLILSVRI